MKIFVTVYNEELKQRIDIEISNAANIEEVLNQIGDLPKDEKGTPIIGNTNIWSWVINEI